MFLLNIISPATLFNEVSRLTRLQPVQEQIATEGAFQFEIEGDNDKAFYGVQVKPVPKYTGTLFGIEAYGEDQILVVQSLYKTDSEVIATEWNPQDHLAQLRWVSERSYFSRIPTRTKTTHLDQGQAILSENGIDSIGHCHKTSVTQEGVEINLPKPQEEVPIGDIKELAESLYLAHARLLNKVSSELGSD